MTAGARLPRRKGFEAARPPDVSDDRWQAALRGLSAFVAGGWADQAERLGWTRDELFRVPPLWGRGDLAGAALLTGDNEAVGVTADAIKIKTPSGSTQTFCRRQLDFALMFESRRKQLGGNVDPGEARLRAREWTIREYQRLNKDASRADATCAVDAMIASQSAKGAKR